MKKIGILLAFAPEQPIKNHGIGRLTAFIISAMLKSDDVQVAVAVPAWYKKIILEFFADHHISPDQIELITTDGVPCLLRVRTFAKRVLNRFRRVKHQQLKFNLRGGVESANFKLLIKGLATSSIFYFVLINILLFVFVLPFVVIGSAVLAVAKLLKRGLNYIISKVGSQLKLRLKRLLVPLSAFRRNTFIHRVYQEVRKAELGRLIKKINNNGKDIEAWFIPTLFWPEVVDIRAKKIVAAPDIVFFDFPLLFANQFFGMICGQIDQTIRVADHLICYSEHVKHKHLIEGFQVAESKISVVKHGSINLGSLLSLENNHLNYAKHKAHHLFRTYQLNYLFTHPYLKDFNLTDAGYIFYSSQIRPHKNFMSLIKAYEILLRKRFINIKLVTTANLMQDSEVWNYIVNHNLQYDILCFTDVSSEVLAALNHMAICAVNPSLFEGGFPFTFTEAYSVGTPSVMGSIPVVLDEVRDPALQEKMLFDPYNVTDMVDKIEWAVNNRDELFALEAPLYQKMEARSWEIVANDYINVFKSVGSHQDEVFV